MQCWMSIGVMPADIAKAIWKMLLAMPTMRRGIIAFIAKVATMRAAPMKPMISKIFMTRVLA